MHKNGIILTCFTLLITITINNQFMIRIDCWLHNERGKKGPTNLYYLFCIVDSVLVDIIYFTHLTPFSLYCFSVHNKATPYMGTRNCRCNKSNITVTIFIKKAKHNVLQCNIQKAISFVRKLKNIT